MALRTRPLTLDDLRRYAVARSLFRPTTLGRALERLGFVQADPIRAPARAQDLILRHRVRDYRAGELERRYPYLPLEEDMFVNYGFLLRRHQALLHPRRVARAWGRARQRDAEALLALITARGTVHPREAAAHLSRRRVRNWFGGATHATTALLDELHWRGLVRVARRDGGTRVYALRPPATEELLPPAPARLDALIDLIVRKYAPLPAATLAQLSLHLIRATPQWRRQRAAALARAKGRLPNAQVEGVHWYWPAGESPRAARWSLDEAARLLAPFDPVVWDRRRFELFWGWRYRFEAYTPAAKRTLGYYALPLLFRGRALGWATVSVVNGRVSPRLGYIDREAARDPALGRALEEELARLARFLGL